MKNNIHCKVTGLCLIVLGALLGSISGTLGQQVFVQSHLSVESIVAVKLFISGILILFISCFGNRRLDILNIWKSVYDANKLILFGTIGVLGTQYTYFSSIKEGNIAVATLLLYSAPIFLGIYSIPKNNNSPNKEELLSYLFFMIGIYFFFTKNSIYQLNISILAILWGILSGMALAFYINQLDHLCKKWALHIVLGWGMVIGGIVLLLLNMLSTNEFILLSTVKSVSNHTLLLLFIIVFGTILTSIFYVKGTNYITPKDICLYSCIEPLTAILFSVLFFNISYTTSELIGALCLIGVFVLLTQLNPPIRRTLSLVYGQQKKLK
ncbi:DMT family transporter [Bacillus wiedmannii]|uniref:DMT family transporter n=1 Tax=Bacillus wiedmannii TaxID=1890302 RepID=UPI000BFAAE83|nr:EamA family transporter [Bacillus wiedmannii]PFZ88711.1 EamA family transporter [Bacillus wiedmannii]